MIPVKLTLEGLYSYQARQTIDFSELTSAGLFGIFGATGSGKSSILEAVSYALYGDTERLNARDKRSYNMMNLKSNKAFISFDFYNYENELYRTTREFKRNAKKFEDVRTSNVTFYQFKEGAWQPLAHTHAEKIVGLNYDNFMRTIIIPQGHFKDFIALRPKDRTKMMKEIFPKLNGFDLQDKAAILRKANQSELDRLMGLLSSLGNIDKEEVTAKKQALEEGKQQFTQTQKKHEELDKKFRLLLHLKNDFVQLQEEKTAFSALEKQQKDIQKAEQTVAEYERSYKKFHQPLSELEKRKVELSKKQFKQKEIQEKLSQLQKEQQAKQHDLEKVTSDFEQIAQKKAEVDDLQFIAKILTLSEEIKICKERRRKGEKLVGEKDAENKNIQAEINTLEKESASLKAQKPDTKLMREMGEWFGQMKNLDINVQKQRKKVAEKEEEIKAIFYNLKKQDIDPETFDIFSEKQKKELDRQEEDLNQKKERLKVKEKLSEHAHNLVAGEACPLCGSLEHPHIAEAEDVSLTLIEINKSLDEVIRQKEHLQAKQTIFTSQKTLKQNLEKTLKQEKESLQDLDQAVKAHQAAFQWVGFDRDNPEAFKGKQKEADKIDSQIDEVEEKLEEKRHKEKNIRDEVEKYRKKLNQLEKEEGLQQKEKDTHTTNLKYLKVGDYEDTSAKNVEELAEKLRQKNADVEQQHKILKEALDQISAQIVRQESDIENQEAAVAEVETAIEKITLELKDAVKEEAVSDLDEVRKILAQEIDTALEHSRIQQFKIDFSNAQTRITALEKRLGDVSFSDALFQKEKSKWEQSKQTLQEENDRVVSLKNEVERLEKDYAKKQELQKQQEQLEKRAENLTTLFNLFKGKGFVDYVSSLYLSKLCNQANLRFRRMTRNQLMLKLGDENDFEIIDHLNEGKIRSVKTLSGGQSFQVSLSLALALAESVQTHAKAEKKFFFIDEGFGTQDADAINIIFETLLNLNREHKIVGIISHVEALKDRIPKALMIEKDAELGSLIKYD